MKMGPRSLFDVVPWQQRQSIIDQNCNLSPKQYFNMSKIINFDTVQPAVGMLLFVVVLIVTIHLLRIVKMYQRPEILQLTYTVSPAQNPQ